MEVSDTGRECATGVHVRGPVQGAPLVNAGPGRSGFRLTRTRLLAIQSRPDRFRLCPLTLDAVAQLLVGALNEAAVVASHAADPDRARREAREGIERVLAGIATEPRATSTRRRRSTSAPAARRD